MLDSDPRSPFHALIRAVDSAAAAVRGGDGAGSAQLRLERPKHENQGDYSTNAAMLLAPALSQPPRVIAERLGAALVQQLGDDLTRAEVAGPGFLNLVMSDRWHRKAVASILEAGEQFGSDGTHRPERILVEFVSANPTGPLLASSGGRHGAYGDALARILEHFGHTVSREYYFNDAGGQIRLLGESVRARARGEEVPEGGYQGEYVIELANGIPDAADRDADELAHDAVEVLLASIKASLERFGVRFDRFFRERALHEGEPSALERALALLEDAGHVYRSEGALWLRTTSFGDTKDRVVVRSNGNPTYLASDIAYLQDKRDRGFERQLTVVGADHHAYVGTLKAAMAALGGDPETVEVPLIQWVHLVEGKERVGMSKRRGEFVTLDELLDEIGVDATRFFMLQRSHDRTLELDVELARKQSNENPVYYVQYAHARIASMLGRLSDERIERALAAADGWQPALAAVDGEQQPALAAVDAGQQPALHASERRLIKKLADFPWEISEAAERRGPHRIAAYALELAQDFTAFYRDCRVVGATPEAVESFRIALSVAAQRVIATSLGLLGVSAPRSM